MSPRHLLLLTLVAAAAVPASASAAEIGGAAPDGDTQVCSVDQAQTIVAASARYTVPSDGVITSFRAAHAGEPGVPFLFRVFRAAGNGFESVGRVPAEIGEDGSSTAAARIPVRTGDRLGLSKPSGGELGCFFGAPESSDIIFLGHLDDPGDPVPPGVALSNAFPNVAATLEPDADGDGFGDDSQDGCPADADRQHDCVPPPAPEAPPAPPAPAPAPAVVAPAAVPPAPAALCKVPKLRGLTLKAAKRRLAAAGCRPGKVRRGRGARLRVRRQSVAAGLSVAAGTRVDVALKRKR